MKKIFNVCSSILLYILFFGILCFLFSKKQNYMVDELLTYNLSNAEQVFYPQDGVEYIPASEIFLESLASDGKLDFSHVWKLQSEDSSPPFYYAVVHVVCTLFPNTFSMKYAAVVNIIFQLLTLIYLRKIVRLFIQKEWLVWSISLFYILCPGILSIGALLRMYSMVIFIVTSLLYVLLKNIEKYRQRDYILLFALIVCGALTHYYFIVYIFFLFFVLGIIMLVEKRYRELIYLVGTSVLSGIASYLIFPAAIVHLQKSGRGIEAQDNFENSNLIDLLSVYYKTINKLLFGYFLPFLVVFFAVVLIFSIVRKHRQNGDMIFFEKKEKYRYYCVLIPVVFYLMLIAKVAPYGTMRYISPIFSVAIVGVFCLLYKCLGMITGNKRILYSVFLMVMVAILVIDYTNCKWGGLYLSSGKRVAYAEKNGGSSDAICVYDQPWEIYTGFLEMKNFKSITFYQLKNYNEFAEKNVELKDQIALFLVETDKSFLSDFLEANPQYEVVKKYNKLSYSQTVYLKRSDNVVE